MAKNKPVEKESAHTNPRPSVNLVGKSARKSETPRSTSGVHARDTNAGGPSPDITQVYGPLGYLKELFQRFGADQCASWAASLSFFAILSIAPILLCGLAVLGYLIHSPEQAAEHVKSVVANFVPDQHSANQVIAQMGVEKSAATLMKSRGIAGIIGLVSLFWAAIQIFINAAAPMNAAFRVTETRGWVKLRVDALALLLGAGALFVLSLVLTSLVQRVASFAPLGILLSIATNAVMFAVIYRYLPAPAANVHWKSAGFAGAIIAILWEGAKLGFAFYLGRFANYNKVYGSLGVYVSLILWIYYSSMILLLGAELAKLHQDVDDEKRRAAAGQ